MRVTVEDICFVLDVSPDPRMEKETSPQRLGVGLGKFWTDCHCYLLF